MGNKGIATIEWIMLIGSIMAATVGVVAYAFGNFETKESSRELREQIWQRLEKIENKIDYLIENEN